MAPCRQRTCSAHFEYVLSLSLCVCREVEEEVFTSLSKTASLIEGIINDCLGLPSGLLKEFNSDRSSDFLMAHQYFAATEGQTNGLTPHEDSNSITLVFQDDAGGLEVFRNGEWIPATPEPGAIVVNVGDIIQVHTNPSGCCGY
ncbi:unnamed protein product [Linum tenue]|uniref:Fe2OG dioxygenase domain-containing protein n=1 Tax=Linum tenue TaxID=586396 RepID=A0AAV0PJR1_9ROSI|nr:unnamed protein product [Linum tenue]